MIAQAVTVAGIEADLYEVPVDTEFVSSTGIACNTNETDAKVSLAVCPNGDATEKKHYIYFEYPVPPHETLAYTFGLTLDAGCVVRVWSDSDNAVFQLYGKERAV